jgi:hypothetical protein
LSPTRRELETQRLINDERRRRHIPPVEWSSEMHRLARSHSESMAAAGHLFHSNRFALQGGENCFMGSSSPHAIVRGWMSSTAGHREWLLDRRVKSAAVGISNGGHGRGYHTYVAWSFSGGTFFSGFSILPTASNIHIPRTIVDLFRLPDVFHIPEVLRGTLRVPAVFHVPHIVRSGFHKIFR